MYAIDKQFCKSLVIIRKQLGLTQEQLAHELNVSFSACCRSMRKRARKAKLAVIAFIRFVWSKELNVVLLIR